MTNFIPLNRPFLTGEEATLVLNAINQNQLSGDGNFTKQCEDLINHYLNIDFSLITNSCTSALEMSAILADISPGDEVIMPSFTFSSTANAFVLRGAVPVFVDIRSDTLNLDETKIEEAISSRTKAIIPVHYAGVACEMDEIISIASKKSIKVIEDAAQGMLSTYKGKSLGTHGDFGCLSFHATKNIVAGEGGAIIVKNPEKYLNAEMIREKGTDRSQFIRGEIDKYTWKTVGSSYLPSEITSAFLASQLMNATIITAKRMKIWDFFYEETKTFEEKGLLRRPRIPSECKHNAHIFYVVLSDNLNRNFVLSKMKKYGVQAAFHYTPLHLAPAGLKFGRASGVLSKTVFAANNIIRLPLWPGMTYSETARVIAALSEALEAAENNATQN